MDPSVFLAIASPDISIKSAAEQTIQSAYDQEGFPGFLVGCIKSAAAEGNLDLLKCILIVFVHFIRKRSSLLLGSEGFIQELGGLLFAVPFGLRSHIEEGILSIGLALPLEFNFNDFFQQILTFAQSSGDAMNICTAMSLSIKWIECRPSSPFLTDLGGVILPLLTSVSQDNVVGPTTVGVIAELVAILIKRRQIIIHQSLDQIIQILTHLFVSEATSDEMMTMKVKIATLFRKLISAVFEDWKSIEEIAPWREHFVQALLGGIMGGIMTVITQNMSTELFGQMLHLFYLCLHFEIAPDKIVSHDFVEKFVLNGAKLTSDDSEDYQYNPAQFISFCCSHGDVGFYSTRVIASRIIHLILEKYIALYNPLPFLAAPCDDPVAMEAKIFLLERCAKDGCMPGEVFEAYFNLLTSEQPPFIVSSLIRMVTPVMASETAVVGISVAEHFIINSVCPVIQDAAMRLMLACFSDFEGRLSELNGVVDMNLGAIAPILLNHSNEVGLETPTILLEKIFQIGGEQLLGVVPEIVSQFFALWRSAQSDDDDGDLVQGPSLMNSIESILEIVPADSELMAALSDAVIRQLVTDMTDFPDNASLSDQISVAAVFSRKLSTPLPHQYQFIDFVNTMLLSDVCDPSLLVSNVVSLVCPIMLKTGFPAYDPFIQFLGKMINPETDVESLAQCMVLASCLIQIGGVDFFPLVTSTAQVLVATQESLILVGSLYVFAAAFFVNAEAAAGIFTSEPALVDLVCNGIATQANLACRELKIALFVLFHFTQMGCARAFALATNLMAPFVEVKVLDDMIPLGPDTLIQRERMHKEEDLVSMTPLLMMPLDSIDPLAMYEGLTQAAAKVGV